MVSHIYTKDLKLPYLVQSVLRLARFRAIFVKKSVRIQPKLARNLLHFLTIRFCQNTCNPIKNLHIPVNCAKINW